MRSRAAGKLLVGEPYFDPRTPIVLDRKTLGDAEVGDLVVVTTGRGRAAVEQVLGPSSAIENVLAGLLYHTGVRPVRGRDLEADREADALPIDPDGEERGRVDLRSLLAFTIDPDEAKDFDDAISMTQEGTASALWVHIADVSRYVRPGTALDRDAAQRGVSVYVPGAVEPMLPERLSNGLCSLVPSRDRYCVTVEVPFATSLEPGEPVFYRSVIRSSQRLTYSHAEAILAGRERAGPALTRCFAARRARLVGAAAATLPAWRAADRDRRDRVRLRRGRAASSARGSRASPQATLSSRNS